MPQGHIQGVKVQLHPFFTLALDGGDGLTSCLGHFTLQYLIKRRITGVQCRYGWLEDKKKIGQLCCESNCVDHPACTRVPALLSYHCSCCSGVCVCVCVCVNHISFNINLFHVLQFFRNWPTS
jgi:hypothetical protein